MKLISHCDLGLKLEEERKISSLLWIKHSVLLHTFFRRIFHADGWELPKLCATAFWECLTQTLSPLMSERSLHSLEHEYIWIHVAQTDWNIKTTFKLLIVDCLSVPFVSEHVYSTLGLCYLCVHNLCIDRTKFSFQWNECNWLFSWFMEFAN